jgi:NADH:ubiquinone oxidoreductase subunit 5 (subunit L)/multisubunit Na+/H+ antiporter MnhA subunit
MGKLACFTLTIVGFGVALLLGLPNIYGSSPGWSLLILILGVITAFGGAFTGYDDIGSRLLFFICFAGSIIIMIFGFLNFYKNIVISLALVIIGLIGGLISAFSIVYLERHLRKKRK